MLVVSPANLLVEDLQMGNDANPRIKLRASVLTDVGVVRDHNEDSAHVDDDNRYFIVADGMGGHAAGEVASAMAVETVRDALKAAADELAAFAAQPGEDGRRQAVTTLESAVRSAHQAVYERGLAEADKQGMGTTLDVVLVAGPEAFVAHVGDSRTYLLRDGKAAQITTDHTVAEVLVIEGKLSIEEAQISPLRTILVNAIGVAPDVGVEMAHVQLRSGDMLLLCSDGLHDYFPIEQELADHILGTEPDAALKVLIDLANERGGHDNITGIIVEVLECDSDGVIEMPRGLEVSNGVPSPIDRDDTLPVDVEDVGPAPNRRTDPSLSSVSTIDDTLDHPVPAVAEGNDDSDDESVGPEQGNREAVTASKDDDGEYEEDE